VLSTHPAELVEEGRLDRLLYNLLPNRFVNPALKRT
jgi:hypothetical protein